MITGHFQDPIIWSYIKIYQTFGFKKNYLVVEHFHLNV